MADMTIGQLAQAADVGVETVRFYERRGLLEQPPKRETGYRRYPAEASARLRFIRRAKALGFSLDEIAELLALRSRPRETRDQVRAAARAKVADIEGKIRDLESIRTVLAHLADDCEHYATDEQLVAEDHCPILAALEDPPGDPDER